jgi:solute carrier family 25 S-adenosylmethionine transporter 26
MSAPTSGAFFVIYYQGRHLISRHAPSMPNMCQDAASATIAEVVVSSIKVPCEVLKQRMQTQCASGGSRLSVFNAAKQIATRGSHGFYTCYGAQLFREVPFSCIQMSLFEAVRHSHPWAARARECDSVRLHSLVGISSGGIAGAIAGAVTTPLDVAKTRIQLRTATRPLDVTRTSAVSLPGMLIHIYREAGLRGLSKGLLPRTVQCGLGGSLWLGAFEVSKHLLMCPSPSKLMSHVDREV